MAVKQAAEWSDKVEQIFEIVSGAYQKSHGTGRGISTIVTETGGNPGACKSAIGTGYR